ncbi:hypothetical protein Droror1_Dr00020258, partial [Drosera rotundifolia]
MGTTYDPHLQKKKHTCFSSDTVGGRKNAPLLSPHRILDSSSVVTTPARQQSCSTFSSNPYPKPALFSLIFLLSLLSTSFSSLDSSLIYVWPLPSYHTSGADTFSVDPYLSLSFAGDSEIVTEAFERYRSIIFKHVPKVSGLRRFLTRMLLEYDISVVEIVVENDEEE